MVETAERRGADKDGRAGGVRSPRGSRSVEIEKAERDYYAATMAESIEQIGAVRPQIRRRECGGWLAVCPRKLGLSFGVTAATEQEARDQFRFTLNRWLEIIRDGEKSAGT